MEIEPVIKKMDFKGDGHPFGFGLSPEADWKVIIVSTVVLAILASAINLFIFFGIDKAEIFTVDITESEENPILDLKMLQSVNDYYQQKGEEFERVKNGTVSITDPSI